MPVFEGLLNPKHDKIVQELLFTLCTWHGLAKLRLHTSSTLAGLKVTMKSLGQVLRKFVKNVCSQYKTRALPREEAARTRRRANAAAKGKSATKSKARGKKPDIDILPKLLNLFTYKLHALGDYVAAILRFGPSDGFSTQTVCFSVPNYEILLTLYRVNWNTKRLKGFMLVRTRGEHLKGRSRNINAESAFFVGSPPVSKRDKM